LQDEEEVEERSIVETSSQIPRQIVSRGDSFDIGSREVMVREPEVIRIIQNPGQLAELLNIDMEQANNIKALITGGGAGMSAKYLSKYFGSSVSGAFGGFIAGIIADKIFGNR